MNYFKLSAFYALSLVDSVLNFVCSVVHIYPKSDLATIFLAGREIKKMNKDLSDHNDERLEKIEKADFLVAKAKEIDEAPVIPVIPVSLPIQPKLPPVGPSPAQTAYDEAETYWKPKKFN